MYCPNCGKKLITSNQKFCHNCGTETLAIPKETIYKTERIQNKSTHQIYYIPSKQQLQLKRGPPEKYSKLCLHFGLSSVILGIVSLIVGYFFFRFVFTTNSLLLGRLVFSIGILLFRAAALILGVFSRISSSKAVMIEAYNDIEKAGSIFGTIGIIINLYGLALSFIGPWAFFRFLIPIYQID